MRPNGSTTFPRASPAPHEPGCPHLIRVRVRAGTRGEATYGVYDRLSSPRCPTLKSDRHYHKSAEDRAALDHHCAADHDAVDAGAAFAEDDVEQRRVQRHVADAGKVERQDRPYRTSAASGRRRGPWRPRRAWRTAPRSRVEFSRPTKVEDLPGDGQLLLDHRVGAVDHSIRAGVRGHGLPRNPRPSFPVPSIAHPAAARNSAPTHGRRPELLSTRCRCDLRLASRASASRDRAERPTDAARAPVSLHPVGGLAGELWHVDGSPPIPNQLRDSIAADVRETEKADQTVETEIGIPGLNVTP